MKKRLSLQNKTDIITDSEVKEFYQSKFDFYKDFTKWIVILAAISSSTYLFSDCQIFGRFAYETVLPRLMIYPVVLLYIFLQHSFKGYKKQCVMTYLALNAVVICTCWACHYLPDLSHVNEGLLIMQCMFFAAGFSAPFYYNFLGYGLYYIEILVATWANSYTNLNYIISLGLPLTIGIILAQFFLQKLYVSHFKMERHLKEASVRDNLTGIYNRNYITERIEKDKRNIFKDNSAVMIFDIDLFKNVNDTLGHTMGDMILKEISELTLENIRETDYFIRWGGEEFVILMPNTSIEEACVLAERLRNAVEKSTNLTAAVTISVGVSKLINRDIQASVNEADKYLYEAKRTGRNKVVSQREN